MCSTGTERKVKIIYCTGATSEVVQNKRPALARIVSTCLVFAADAYWARRMGCFTLQFVDFPHLSDQWSLWTCSAEQQLIISTSKKSWCLQILENSNFYVSRNLLFQSLRRRDEKSSLTNSLRMQKIEISQVTARTMGGLGWSALSSLCSQNSSFKISLNM